MMTSQILKPVDFAKTQKSRYLENEILFFLQIKNSLITNQELLCGKNNFVAEVTFKRWNIKDETIIIKSYNAPTQYKNKFPFQSMMDLSNKYNVRIIRIYGAASHGKGLIDAISSFGVKTILRRDIVSYKCWMKPSRHTTSFQCL